MQVVVGGVNGTFMWRELLDTCPAIDYVLRGYAQPGLRALMGSIETDATPTGLICRRNAVFSTAPITNVVPADFARPALDGLPVDRHLEWTSTYPLLTHTGCGFSCNFCTSVMPGPYQNREVYRPSEDVIAEMLAALEMGFDRFFMSANLFTSQRERCVELREAIRQAGIPKRAVWDCMTRVEFVDEVCPIKWFFFDRICRQAKPAAWPGVGVVQSVSG